MIDPMTLVTSISSAIDYVNKLKAITAQIKDVEIKGALSDLALKLSEAQDGIVSLRNELRERDQKIEELLQQLDQKQKTVGYRSARYYVNDDGEPTGQAFCQNCYHSTGKLIPLATVPASSQAFRGKVACGVCQSMYDEKDAPLNAGYFIAKQREAAKKLNREFSLEIFP